MIKYLYKNYIIKRLNCEEDWLIYPRKKEKFPLLLEILMARKTKKEKKKKHFQVTMLL
jgi:hypothetical protein